MSGRRPLPAAIQNAPELEFGLELYFQSFWELCTCRTGGGMGIVPLSWLTIREYAAANGFDEEQTDDLLYYARVMDQTYMDFHASKQETK